LGDGAVAVTRVKLLLQVDANLSVANVAAYVLMVETVVGASLALGNGAEAEIAEGHEDGVGAVYSRITLELGVPMTVEKDLTENRNSDNGDFS
jgi:hypothetical protein